MNVERDWSELPEDPDELLAVVGGRLVDEVVAAVPGWVQRSVEQVHRAWIGSFPAEVAMSAERAATACAAQVRSELDQLVRADVDQQRSTPLQVVRRAASHATAVLHGAGVPPIVRSPRDEARAIDDVYGLEPASLADVDLSLHELGLVWGAAKAKAHLARHRPSGG